MPNMEIGWMRSTPGLPMNDSPFHLAFPIIDLEQTRRFYVDVLGCRVGREAERWIDFDFFGHQISAHVYPDACTTTPTNPVDGDGVPVRHFGCVLSMETWSDLRDRLTKMKVEFLIALGNLFLKLKMVLVLCYDAEMVC